MEINKQEIWRYLGYSHGEKDIMTAQMIDQCLQELEQIATPRFLYEIVPLKFGLSNEIDMGFLTVTSKNLFQNLRDCKEVAVLAVTLGTEVDRWINRYAKINITKSVVMQAVAGVLIEAWCDLCQEQIQIEAKKRGYFLRPRYSPGYGDFSLSSQKAIVQMLQAPKKIGLTVTDSLMLVPVKSITAVIGFSEKNSKCDSNSCEQCGKENCSYRR